MENYGSPYPQLHDIDIDANPSEINLDLEYVFDINAKYPIRFSNDILNGITPLGSQNSSMIDHSYSNKRCKKD